MRGGRGGRGGSRARGYVPNQPDLMTETGKELGILNIFSHGTIDKPPPLFPEQRIRKFEPQYRFNDGLSEQWMVLRARELRKTTIESPYFLQPKEITIPIGQSIHPAEDSSTSRTFSSSSYSSAISSSATVPTNVHQNVSTVPKNSNGITTTVTTSSSLPSSTENNNTTNSVKQLYTYLQDILVSDSFPKEIALYRRSVTSSSITHTNGGVSASLIGRKRTRPVGDTDTVSTKTTNRKDGKNNSSKGTTITTLSLRNRPRQNSITDDLDELEQKEKRKEGNNANDEETGKSSKTGRRATRSGKNQRSNSEDILSSSNQPSGGGTNTTKNLPPSRRRKHNDDEDGIGNDSDIDNLEDDEFAEDEEDDEDYNDYAEIYDNDNDYDDDDYEGGGRGGDDY